MRLIDADELIERFKELKGIDSLANMFVADVINEIKKQPAAYDTNKIVKKIEERRKLLRVARIPKSAKAAANNAFLMAIEDIKSGGIE